MMNVDGGCLVLILKNCTNLSYENSEMVYLLIGISLLLKKFIVILLQKNNYNM